MKIEPYYQRRRCSPITLDSGNIRFIADIRGGSQDLCKFSLDFMPASYISTVYRKRHAVVVFKCLFMTATNTAATGCEVRDKRRCGNRSSGM